MTRDELHVLMALLEKFDASIANDEPSHLACIILGLHCHDVLERMPG